MRGSSLIIAAEWARSSRAFILRVIFFPCLRWIDVIITIIEVSVGVVGVLWISIFCVETVSILLHALINLTHLFYGHLSGIVIFLLCNQFFRFLHIQFFLFLVRYHLLLCFEASQEAVVTGALLGRSKCTTDLAEFSSSGTLCLLGKYLDILPLLVFRHGLLMRCIRLLHRLETLYLCLRSWLRSSRKATRSIIIGLQSRSYGQLIRTLCSSAASDRLKHLLVKEIVVVVSTSATPKLYGSRVRSKRHH